MNATSDPFVLQLSRRYGVPVEQLEQRVRRRQARSLGLLGPRGAARTLRVSLACGELQERLGERLAASAHHVSGADEDDALRSARAEAGSGRLCTLGYWAPPDAAPEVIARHYARAVEMAADAGLPASVSIKADLLGFDRALLAPVLRAARVRDVRVHFDAQGHDTVSRTHALVEDAVAQGYDVSATLPSRFRRSMEDADRFVRLGIPVRVVKGQGGDPQEPKRDPRRSFLELVDRLAGRAAFVGVATHDRRTAEPALRRLAAAGTPCGLEQMRSLPRLDFLADRLGLPTRVYIAYGHAGLPYAISEFLRRPAIVAWILRDLILRHAPGTPRSP